MCIFPLCKDFLRRFSVTTPEHGEKVLYLDSVQEGAGAAGRTAVVTPESTTDPLIPALEDVGTVNDPYYFPLC